MAQSIYEKYGGFASVNRVVMAFYDQVLDHDALGPYFEDVDMPSLIDHQTKFIASLLGGPASFTDDHLKRAHARLEISPQDFEDMKSVLAETLEDQGFEPEDITVVVAAIEARRSSVLAG